MEIVVLFINKVLTSQRRSRCNAVNFYAATNITSRYVLEIQVLHLVDTSHIFSC